MSDGKKKVDESWKDNVEKEKVAAPLAGADNFEVPEPSFSSIVTMLGMQAFVALGELQNGEGPTDAVPSVDLPQAKLFIAFLEILSQKTKGNLTEPEAAMLQEILYGLKMKFVEKSGVSG